MIRYYIVKTPVKEWKFYDRETAMNLFANLRHEKEHVAVIYVRECEGRTYKTTTAKYPLSTSLAI